MNRVWKRPASAALALTLLASPAAAKDEGSPVFADFQRFCLDKVGDVEATVEAAKADGYSQVDDGRTELADTNTFVLEQGGVRRMVLVKRDDDPPIPNGDEVICGVGRTAPDPEMMQEAIQWAGVPQDMPHSEGDTRVYTFAVTPGGGRKDLSAAKDVELAKVAKEGGVWMLLATDAESPRLVLVFLRAQP